MQFDAILNLVWVVLGLCALGLTARVLLRSSHTSPSDRCWRFVGVFLVVVALFPYISASDDILRVEHLQNQPKGTSHERRGHTRADDLVRLYETMDAPLACEIVSLVLTFVFVALLIAPFVTSTESSSPSFAGRSPPLTASAA